MSQRQLDGRVVLIILLVTSVLFFIGFVTVLFLYFYQLANLIQVSDCPSAINNYSVLPATTGTVQNNCNGPCTFTAATLQDAINLCNSQSAVCQQFIWPVGGSGGSGPQVSFVSSGSNTPGTNGQTNLYIRPVDIVV